MMIIMDGDPTQADPADTVVEAHIQDVLLVPRPRGQAPLDPVPVRAATVATRIGADHGITTMKTGKSPDVYDWVQK